MKKNENPLKHQLLTKIKNKTAVLGVIGLGYVGLPLALEKAKAGYKTIGFDIQEKKVHWVNKGHNYIGDIIDSDLKKVVDEGLLQATSDFSFVKDIDTICICVPTPIDIYQQPDLSYVKNSTENIAKYLYPGMLVVLESTTYPGTTEELVKPILEKNSGLKCGKDFFLAFSPERVDPGNLQYKTKNTPKVVGGVTPDCTEVAASLYRHILQSEVHIVSSPKIAEMEKIFENIFRYINIALVNEIAILCNKMDIDVWEVIEAAKTKPYGFMPFYPGPGVGGHCIPLDPFYLTWKAREYNCSTKLIELAGEINKYMPDYVVERAMKLLNQKRKPMNGSKVLLMGIAYKQDIDDVRESPALKVIEHLEKQGAIVQYNDPYIPEVMHKGKQYNSLDFNVENIQQADIVIITTCHTCYDYQLLVDNARILFDTKNATRGMERNKERVVKL